MTKYKIKKNDMVVVIRGAEKNKSGKVLEIQKSRGRVLVEGINVRKRAVRRTQERPQGGIVEQEQPVHISNVMEESRYKAKVQAKHQDPTKQEASS